MLGAYDPEPDYFFHWYRDSAVVIDALRLLYEDPSIDVDALGHLSDFVHFSISLEELDGRSLISSPRWRRGVAPDFEQFVRSDDDLSPGPRRERCRRDAHQPRRHAGYFQVAASAE